jgi:hypothetical protein
MALIIDPDLLNQNTEVTINTSTKKITLSVAGNLSTDGVTLKALYSFLKEEWKNDSSLIPFPFPMVPITDEQFEFVNGWDLYNDNSKYLVRTGGWALKSVAGVTEEEWAGIVTLGSVGATDQIYFQQTNGGAATNIQLVGAVNQAVKIYGDATHGNFNYRSYFKLFVREQAKKYADADLADIGVSTMTYQVYRFPLANEADLKVTHDDTTADAYGVTITWYAGAQARVIGGVSRNFHVIIDGNNKTAEEIYEAVQSALRKATDIDAGAGTMTGKITNALLQFVGDNLYTLSDATGGVFIDNFQAADTNRLFFLDDTGTQRSFPYVAALTVQFGDNLVNDADARYWIYFTNDDAGGNLGYDYGTANAILVNTNDTDSTTFRAVSSNVATLTTGTAHGLVAGDMIRVAGMTDATYNGTFTIIAAPTTTTLTYALTHADEGSTADTTGTITKVMSALVGGSGVASLSFDYDGNVQRGTNSNGVDAPITAVAIGLSTGQFVKATGTISRSTSNSISLVAPLERNYQNPA